jgi:hypothetical protein
MPWTDEEKGSHIEKTRLRAAAITKFELTVRELKHMLKCNECLDIFSDLRDKFRAAKSKTRNRAS